MSMEIRNRIVSAFFNARWPGSRTPGPPDVFFVEISLVFMFFKQSNT